jgi:dTDP-4-dehydrorhamnose reductase
MLGSMVARVLAESPGLEVTTTARPSAPSASSAVRRVPFDVAGDLVEPVLDSDGYEWVVNAIGTIKPRIDERDPASVQNAVTVNSLFPFQLATAAQERGQRVIQIATDCVYSGTVGSYDESAPHDPLDVYGKTKSLGETPAANVIHLRCSIIGPEVVAPASLLEWILSAAPGAELNGFADHLWNGVTTLHFAKLSAGLIGGAAVRAHQHVVPGDAVNKADLLSVVLSAFGRDDVTVVAGRAPSPVDRTLATRDADANAELWRAAGYDTPPTIEAMVRELAAYAGSAPGTRGRDTDETIA